MTASLTLDSLLKSDWSITEVGPIRRISIKNVWLISQREASDGEN